MRFCLFTFFLFLNLELDMGFSNLHIRFEWRLWQLLKLTLHKMPLHYMAFFEDIFGLKPSDSWSTLHYMRLLYTTWVFRMFIFGLIEGLCTCLSLHYMRCLYTTWLFLRVYSVWSPQAAGLAYTTWESFTLHGFFECIYSIWMKALGNCSSVHNMRCLYTTWLFSRVY